MEKKRGEVNSIEISIMKWNRLEWIEAGQPNQTRVNRTELNKNPTEQIGIQRIRTEQSGPEHNGIE